MTDVDKILSRLEQAENRLSGKTLDTAALNRWWGLGGMIVTVCLLIWSLNDWKRDIEEATRIHAGEISDLKTRVGKIELHLFGGTRRPLDKARIEEVEGIASGR